MVPIVAQVENDTGVQFEKMEIWYNDTNKAFYRDYQDYITRDCGFLGVPTFLSLKTNRSICGEKSADELERFIIENG